MDQIKDIKIRKPAFAGSFYPESKEKLFSFIKSMEIEQGENFHASAEKKIIGGIVPHAGYIYSGRIALPLFQEIATSKEHYETIIIFHPNHSSSGPPIALDVHDAWQTPLGETFIDLELAENSGLVKSIEAHQLEHSGEVILPLLQYFIPYEFRILPISLKHLSPQSSDILAKRITSAIQTTGRKTLVIASSDFSHFISPALGVMLDNKAIKHILNYQTNSFYNIVQEHHISICGYVPIMILMEFARQNYGHPKVQILARGHSGQTQYDKEVVHYVTMMFFQ